MRTSSATGTIPELTSKLSEEILQQAQKKYSIKDIFPKAAPNLLSVFKHLINCKKEPICTIFITLSISIHQNRILKCNMNNREPEWSPCGFVGDKNAAVKIFYRRDSRDAKNIPIGNRIYFYSTEEAKEAEYKKGFDEPTLNKSKDGILSTEFACQVFPGGDGSYGTFPPPN